MRQFWMWWRDPSVLGSLIGIGLLATFASHPATAADVAQPLTEPEIVAGAPEEQAVVPRSASLTRLVPMSPAQYRAVKAAAQTSSAAPTATQVALGHPSAPEPLTTDVTTSFTGLDRLTSINNGFIFVPPDPIIAKSVLRVLQATNSAIRLTTTVGGVIQTSDLNTFFGAATANGLVFDPKVFFDRNAVNRRFYVVGLQKTATVSRLLLAISRSSDPPNLNAVNWCRYSIDARRNVSTADASYADYPGLGGGVDKLNVSVNNFRFSNDTFTFAIVRSFNKTIASNNAAACPAIAPFSTFQATGTIGNISAFTLQPVQHYSTPSSFPGITNPAYLVNSVFGAGNFYRVWRVFTNAGGAQALQLLGNPIGNFAYNVPPDAPQTGSALLLDTGDNRVTQAAGNGNLISGVHATLCNLSGGANESCVRIVRMLVSQNAAAMNQQGAFGVPNEFFFWPGIAVNISNQAGIPFHLVSPTRTGGRLSSWWCTKDSTSPACTSVLPMTTGTCAQTTNRTGDYIGTALDPSDARSFWMSGERAVMLNGACQWQTQVIRVNPGLNVIPLTP